MTIALRRFGVDAEVDLFHLYDRGIEWTRWAEPLAALSMASADETTDIAAWMLRRGHLDEDSGMLFVGPEAERVYGHRHFMEVLSVFTSSPQFTIVHGRREIGQVEPYVLIRKVEGPRVLALAGQG